MTRVRPHGDYKEPAMIKTIKISLAAMLLIIQPLLMSVSYADTANNSAKSREKISLSLRDVELSEVMQMLSRQQRVNILLSEGVSGRISVNLYEIPLSEAIRAIANAGGYEVEKRGVNYFVIGRDEVGHYVNSGTTQLRTFRLRYANAEDVSQMLEEYVSGYGNITVLKDRNIIVVEDTPEFLQRIKKLVKQLDYRPKQILIEARILEITLDDTEAYGVEWSKLFSSGSAEGKIGRGIPLTSSNGLFLEIIDDNLRVFLDLLQREGRTRTLSTPKLLTIENKTASVIVGDRLGYVNTVTINQVTTENTEFLESGVILEVTPSVDERGRILLEVHPEVSTGTVTDGIPSQTTTSVYTHLLVPDGATSFIGGLIKTQIFKDHTGVPVISKIPLLGRLFSRQEDRKINTEIIVMITPTIVDPADEDWQRNESDKIGSFHEEFLDDKI